ncbi:MAG: M6 family metalloprotease domain-containing protein [Candidatus Zixiibacteriota bacterium]
MSRNSTFLNSTTVATMLGLLLPTLCVVSVQAIPPAPEVLERAQSGQIALPDFLTDPDVRREKGICQPFDPNVVAARVAKGFTSMSTAYTGQFRVLAILVSFTDHVDSVPATFFDSMLFDSSGKTVKNYFNEVSYGQLDLVTLNMPSQLGWETAPQTYAYYVDSSYGTGSYPNNSQKMVEDLVDQIDPVVDFSNYDNDGDGFVDVLLVIHTGSGAEFSTRVTDIWSHKWGLPSARFKDGVGISSYTVQPEYWTGPGDMTIGVYSHELSHGFGLPDLYDTDYSSKGIGDWGLMGYGSWLGPLSRGSSPSHLSAWSKVQVGWVTPTNITVNTTGAAIPNVEQNAVIYRCWNTGNIGSEYFLIENRQKTGYDQYIPGDGLLIWHIEEGVTNNTSEWYPGLSGSNHYEVALEQADGLFELEHDNDNGDGADPFPGWVGKTSFNAISSPNSNAYAGSTSFVSIDNISSSADTMYADMLVGLAADISTGSEDGVLPNAIELIQNYPNPFNPSTVISFTLEFNGQAVLEVFNTLGQKVRTLFDGPIDAGETSVTWDGKDNAGTEAASGIYFYRLSVGKEEQIKKMVLIR